MKHRKPLRRSPLALGRGLQPGTPKPSRKRTPVRGRSEAQRVAYADLRVTVWHRAAGRCERCGTSLLAGFECHHRRLRSQGGRDALVNLVALCSGEGCHTWAHANPEAARAQGWIVPGVGSGPRVDPASVPVLLHDGRMVRLDAEGGYDVVFEADGRVA